MADEEPKAAITMEQQIACVRRELAMRKNVDPKWVTNGRMKQEAADKEIAAMQAVHDTLCGGHPGEPGLATLRQAIIDHTKGEGLFWIGEMLLAELEKETGFKG